MTAGNVMLCACIFFFLLGTVGLVKNIEIRLMEKKQEKHYAALREKEADNG